MTDCTKEELTQFFLPQLETSWYEVLEEELNKPYQKSLLKFLQREVQENTIYPPQHQIFNAFKLTPFSQVKVVVLGQDPYHGPGQAHGLAFSVQKGQKIPPSLRNIYKELYSDLQIPPASQGDLSAWAKQGVLLLNTVLTVKAHTAFSHRGQGWEEFTDQVIKTISQEKENIVFVLWGSPAKAKMNLIDVNKHQVFTSAHPSPLSANRGFFGCRHFSKINHYLHEHGKIPVNWQLPE